jgi:hypothetical protein
VTNPLYPIEQRAKVYVDARAAVAAIVNELNDGIEALKRSHMKELKRCINAAAEQHDKLKSLIEERPELFVKPRTVVMHGVKLGYAKGKGSVEFDDAERLAARVRKHLPEQFDVLVATTHKPLKAALALLTAAELKKLGVTVEGTDDVVVIKPTDSSVDKLVTALLKSATDDQEAVE